ncbi:HET-domain-containing protein, partial [Polyplosphaeria fusca]
MHHKSGTKRTAFVVSAESRPRTVSRDNIVLGIIHPDANLDDFTPRLISPDKIDYDVVLEWFSLCQNLHHDCHLREAAKNLPDLKMIDCTTKGVVAAPDRCDYVALSYVWGLVSNQSDSTWPLVVEDSISVTRSLGFRYLWVDRYCIDQDESESKMTQIAQMNRIYSNAQTTIVAAAGNGPYYGLPGVSSRTRKRQGTFEIDGIILAEVFPDTRQALDASTWISRAWTYQESFLSRRRLIFTDRQVSFVCNTMFCAE